MDSKVKRKMNGCGAKYSLLAWFSFTFDGRVTFLTLRS